MLEFALAWSFMWAVFVGVYQYGYAFYVYNNVMTAVANAAELGSKISYDTGNPSAFTAALKNMVVYGDETQAANATPIANGLTTGNVNVSVTTDALGMPRDLTITITGYSINALFSNINLNNKPRATTMYYGQVTCSSGC